MRITNTLFYANSVAEHQSAMKKMYDVDKQIASGLKIQNSYENSGIYVDAMRLNYEIATLEQTKETSSKAQTFANNTDSTMNQIEDALEQFKTKLIQANNSTNSSTSLNAIADQLEGIKTHLVTLGNTSINGQFLFSGSSLLQKPLEADGTYVGNGESLKAIVSSGVELPYNVTGQSLFLGSDSDYNRVVSTNVSMLNQSKLHPDVMVLNSGVTASKETYLTSEDTIRDMVGDTDSDANNDPNAVFHVSGRKPNGDTFSTSVEMQSDEKVSVLLDKIGQEFGNTPTNRVVDVTMSDHGHIEIKDLKPGNQLMEFHIVGAVDRSTPLLGNKGVADSQNLIAENVQIVDFIKSNLISSNTSSTISSRQDIYAPGQFTLGAPMFQPNGKFVDTSTKLRSFMGDEINQITFSGKDNAGNTIDSTLSIDDATTVQGLLSAVGAAYGVSARLEDGQIYLNTDADTEFNDNKLHVKLEAFKFADNGLVDPGLAEVQMFEIKEDPTEDGTIEVEGVSIAFNAGDTKEDIATLIAAQNSAIILNNPNIASITANDNKLAIIYNNTAGNVNVIKPIIKDALGVETDLIMPISTDDERTITEGSSSSTVNAFSTFESLNLDKFNFTKEGNTLQSNVSQIIKTSNDYATDSTKLIEVAGVDLLKEDAVTLAFDFINTQGVSSHGLIHLYEDEPYSNFQIDTDNSGTYEDNETIELYNGLGEPTKASEVTYRQVMDVIGLALSGTTLQAKVSETNAWAIENAINISVDTTSTVAQKEAAIKTAKEGVGSRAGAYIQKAIDYGILEKKATNAIDEDQAKADKEQALKDADLGQYGDWVDAAKSRVEVTLDHRGQMMVKDKKNSNTPMQLSLEERHAYATPELENPPASTISKPRSALSFMANDAIKIQDPSIDFFQDLDSIIASVRRGEFQLSADNENPRSLGMNYAIDQITHILDHVTKEHTTIGAYSNALSDASDRAEFLSLNVKTVRSQIIDVDIAEAYLQFNQISTSYQAMLSTISKINSMSLLNYM